MGAVRARQGPLAAAEGVAAAAGHAGRGAEITEARVRARADDCFWDKSLDDIEAELLAAYASLLAAADLGYETSTPRSSRRGAVHGRY